MSSMLSQPEEHSRWITAGIRRLGTLSLFRRDAPITSARQAIGWWETRRISYNLIVGGAGILTCVLILIVGLGASILFNSDFGVPGSPFIAVFGVIVYGVLANVCFTGGWVTELIVRRAWPEEADRFATTSFSLGLVFSVFLTLIPALIIGVAGIFKLIDHFLGSIHR